jgi:hypothetical protein
MSRMKNRSLSVSAKTIPYIPALRSYAGTVGAAVLMTQLDFFFGMKDKDGVYRFEDGFYKFLEPVLQKVDQDENQASDNTKYKHGDSWCECLNVTADEFRTMFDKIGKRYTSVTSYRAACDCGDPFHGKYYLSFVDRKTNLTWYLRNHQKVDADLDKIFIGSGAENCSKPSKPHVPHSSWQTPSTGAGKHHLQNWQTPSTELANTRLHTTETTPEITTETTTNRVQVVVDIEEMVEAAVWAFKKGGKQFSNEAGFRHKVRTRILSSKTGPSHEDMQALVAWRADQAQHAKRKAAAQPQQKEIIKPATPAQVARELAKLKKIPASLRAKLATAESVNAG